MDDRKLGYLILAVMICIVGSVTGYAIYLLAFPRQVRVIEFNQVGNLALEDPVSCRGVNIGRIIKLENAGSRCMVIAEFFKPVEIFANYEIITMDKGLMGDRLITLSAGDSTFPLVPPSDTLKGLFSIGVSEMLGLVGKLEDGVSALIPLSQRLLQGTDSTPSFIEQFYTIASAIDSVSRRCAAIAETADRDLESRIRTLNRTLASTVNVTRTMAEKAPPAIESLDKQIEQLSAFADKLENMVNEVIKDLNADATVTKVKDINDIAKAGVMLTPALMINGDIKLTGKLPSKEDLTKMIEAGL